MEGVSVFVWASFSLFVHSHFTHWLQTRFVCFSYLELSLPLFNRLLFLIIELWTERPNYKEFSEDGLPKEERTEEVVI